MMMCDAHISDAATCPGVIAWLFSVQHLRIEVEGPEELDEKGQLRQSRL